MRLALLPRYGRLGASSRLRMFQYEDALRAAGFATRCYPMLEDAYLRDLYAGRTDRRAVAAAYGQRLGQLRASRDAALLMIEKEALPWLPAWAEALALPRGVPVVLDYDDAVFHRYDMHSNPLIRRLLGQKLDRLMARSALVTAGNAYLAERAARAGARRIEFVPTVVDLAHYDASPRPDRSGPPVIGWIGSPSTWAEYMQPMLPLLLSTAEAEGARLLAVGAGQGATGHPLLSGQPWTEETETDLIRRMDIGIMPLTDTPWSRGKCGYKLIQYMACGLPVIASPVGVNARIVEDGVNGFLADTPAQWQAALRRLLHDPALRLRMGQAGRQRIEAEYSLQVWGPRLATLLRDAAGGAAR